MVIFHKLLKQRITPLALGLVVGLVFGTGTLLSVSPTAAEGPVRPPRQDGGYAGPEACAACHEDIHDLWQDSRHAQAFSSPIFQRNWQEVDSEFECLTCHTTGFDPAINTYEHEGVTCEACHGPLIAGHPEERMPIAADHELCSTCHKTTTDEWMASQHGMAEIECQSCHNPHAQEPKAETVTELCANCHQERGDSFTHGTHADAGLECSNCHMFTSPRMADAIEGLVPTGHTFSVGSDACVGCHQDSVHTRDTIVRLTGEIEALSELDIDELRLRAQEQEEAINSLEASSSVRLYTGLAQGGIVGLVTGVVAALVIGRSIRVVELDEEVKEESAAEEDQDE